MIFAYLAYGICTIAVSIGIGFIVAKAGDWIRSYIDIKKMTKADKIEDRR